MSAITMIGSWRVQRHQRGWITADGRCVLYVCGNSWQIINTDKNDYEALMEHGLVGIATGYPLRESAALVADITGCTRQLRLWTPEYDIVDTPLKIIRPDDEHQWQIGLRRVPRGVSMHWVNVYNHINRQRFDTRVQALDAIDTAIATLSEQGS